MTRRQAIRYRLSGVLAGVYVALGLAFIISTGLDPYRDDNGKHLTAGAILVVGVVGTLMIVVGFVLLFARPEKRDRS